MGIVTTRQERAVSGRVYALDGDHGNVCGPMVGVLRTTDRCAMGEEGIVRTVGRDGGYGAEYDAMTDVE